MNTFLASSARRARAATGGLALGLIPLLAAPAPARQAALGGDPYLQWGEQLVAAGSMHTLAVVDGVLLAWGGNAYGQLGLPAGQEPSTPTPVDLPAGNGVVAVSAGDLHTLVIDDLGRVWAAGRNESGQLGNGTFYDTGEFTPVVKDADGEFLRDVVEVQAGGHHSLALDSEGRVWAWGGNGYGQLGAPAGPPVPRAIQVAFPAGVVVHHLSAGAYHSVASAREPSVVSSESVFTWGRNLEGQLGHGDFASRDVPTKVENDPFPYQDQFGLAAGSFFTEIDSYGTELFAGCGWNYYGQLGPGPLDEVEPLFQLQEENGFHLSMMAAGGGHALCMDFPPQWGAHVFAWGLGKSGQLGRGSFASSPFPIQVHKPDGFLGSVTAVAAGEEHSVAMTLSGAIYAWGANACGQIGDGTHEDRTLATQVWP